MFTVLSIMHVSLFDNIITSPATNTKFTRFYVEHT